MEKPEASKPNHRCIQKLLLIAKESFRTSGRRRARGFGQRCPSIENPKKRKPKSTFDQGSHPGNTPRSYITQGSLLFLFLFHTFFFFKAGKWGKGGGYLCVCFLGGGGKTVFRRFRRWARTGRAPRRPKSGQALPRGGGRVVSGNQFRASNTSGAEVQFPQPPKVSSQNGCG